MKDSPLLPFIVVGALVFGMGNGIGDPLALPSPSTPQTITPQQPAPAPVPSSEPQPPIHIRSLQQRPYRSNDLRDALRRRVKSRHPQPSPSHPNAMSGHQIQRQTL